MSKLPKIKSDFSVLSNTFFGTVRSRLLMTAVELQVFDYLEDSASAEQVAASLSCDPKNTAVMLDALSAVGLVKKEHDSYQNMELASELLTSHKPAYLGDWLKLTDESLKSCMDTLTDTIRFGADAALPGSHMNSEQACERFTASHAASSLAGIARQVAALVKELPTFSTCRCMLDLGGGPGINTMAVLDANAQLKATVFDRPEIVRMAKDYIKTYGFSEKIDVIGGDYFNDPLGEGYDLILVSDSLYYEDEKIDLVLNKCYHSLSPNGMLVGIHAVLTDERTKPENMVLGILPETLLNQASLPNKGFFAESLQRCGFHNISSQMPIVRGDHLEMNVGYKTHSV